jgi:hypothetical protein
MQKQYRCVKADDMQLIATGHSMGAINAALAPLPTLIEPFQFHSIVDTEGILKNMWGKKRVG